jgi:glycosyltransferase involved in cell wall biosynthesis
MFFFKGSGERVMQKEEMQVNPDVELSIIMPCLNEAQTLETCIRKAKGFLDKNGINGEIVIGDNGSTDGSIEIAQRCGARVVPVTLRGYGSALYHATGQARGRYIIMGDSDDSYDFTNLMPFVEKLREGYDLVMGNRFLGGIRPGAMPWKNRYIGNPLLSAIGRLFFNCPARDFYCGLRGYSREAFARMDLRTTGMEYASEMVIKSTLMKLRITEVPTTLDPDGRKRPPHLLPWRDGWRGLRFMLLYSPRWLFLLPGLALMIAGLIGVAALWRGPIHIGRVNFDVHTLTYAAAAVLIGFQAVSFSVFTKVFAISEGLLPQDPRVTRVRRYATLENGLIVGGILVLLGLGGSIFAVSDWGRQRFGNLDPEQMLRTVIPSAFAIMLGCQVLLNSFFLSVLGLKVRALGRSTDASTTTGPA